MLTPDGSGDAGRENQRSRVLPTRLATREDSRGVLLWRGCIAGTHLPAELRPPSPWSPPSVSGPPRLGACPEPGAGSPGGGEAGRHAHRARCRSGLDARLESKDAPNFSFRRRSVPRAGHVQPRRRHRALPEVSSLVPFRDGACAHPHGGDGEPGSRARTVAEIPQDPKSDDGSGPNRHRAHRRALLPFRRPLVVRCDGGARLQGGIRDAIRDFESSARAGPGAAVRGHRANHGGCFLPARPSGLRFSVTARCESSWSTRIRPERS